jgi:hypothetical protein
MTLAGFIGDGVLAQDWFWVVIPPFLAILLTTFWRWAAGEPVTESFPTAWADLLVAACVGYIVTYGQVILTAQSDSDRLAQGGLSQALVNLVQIRAERIDDLQVYLFVFLLLSVFGGVIPAVVLSRSKPRSTSWRRAIAAGWALAAASFWGYLSLAMKALELISGSVF